jgi:hypothetical protein
MSARIAQKAQQGAVLNWTSYRDNPRYYPRKEISNSLCILIYRDIILSSIP